MEGGADRSAILNECVYREDSTVILELTTRSMMEVKLSKNGIIQAFN